MISRSTVQRHVAALAVALLMSAIAVGAAIGPGASDAIAHPLIGVTYA